jgi:hypothetical protein
MTVSFSPCALCIVQLAQDQAASAKGSSATLDLRRGLAHCAEFLTVISHGPAMARSLFETRIQDDIRSRLEATEDASALEFCPVCLLYRLAGAMCRHSEEMAHFFGVAKDTHSGFLQKLFDAFKTIRDEKQEKEEHPVRQQANAIYCLTGILKQCDKARNYVFVKEGSASAWFFATRLYKLASLYVRTERTGDPPAARWPLA